jgi:hypothetical protein
MACHAKLCAYCIILKAFFATATPAVAATAAALKQPFSLPIQMPVFASHTQYLLFWFHHGCPCSAAGHSQALDRNGVCRHHLVARLQLAVRLQAGVGPGRGNSGSDRRRPHHVDRTFGMDTAARQGSGRHAPADMARLVSGQQHFIDRMNHNPGISWSISSGQAGAGIAGWAGGLEGGVFLVRGWVRL